MTRRVLLLMSGMMACFWAVTPTLAAKGKFGEKTPEQASPQELRAMEDAHFRARLGLQGVLNGGDHLEQPADREIEQWVKAWTAPKFELRPQGVMSADPLDAPGGTKALKGSSARKALVQALAEVRKGAFGKVARSQLAAKIVVGPELPAALKDEAPAAVLERLSAANRLVMNYARRSTDDKGVPLPEITTLPDGSKVALNQTASFTHAFDVNWRLTEAGWKIASVEVRGATAIL